MSAVREGELAGWLWKRAPRTSDRDKNYIRRMLLSGSRFRRRYFVLSHNDKSLRYFADSGERSAELGAIDLRDILEASTEAPGKEDKAPTQFAINIQTDSRVWSLCADNEDARLEWMFELKRYLPTKTKDALPRRRRSSGQGFGWLRAKSQSAASDELPDNIQVHGNVKVQHARWEAVNSHWQTVTGNVPVTCTSYWSEREPASLSFVEQFGEWCNHFDPLSYVTDTLLNHCAFVTPKQGDVMNKEGEPVDCVFFILEGNVACTKHLFGTDVTFQQLEVGDFFYDVDVMQAESALYTTIAGDQTILLALPAFVLTGMLEDPCYCFLRERLDLDRTSALLVQLFRCMPLFEGFATTQALTNAARLFTIRKAELGDILSTQHKTPNDFLIVLHGSASLLKATENGEQVQMGVVRAGDWFADMGLMYHHPCTASLVASAPMLYLHTDANGFAKLMELGGDSLRKAVQNTVPAQLTRIFASIPLFADLDDQFAMFSAKLNLVQRTAGERLCVQGSFSDMLCIIVSGRCLLTLDFVGELALQRTPSETGVPIGVLRENDFFGEATLLQPSQRVDATVVAETQCVLLVMSGADFQEVAVECPVFRRRLESVLASRPRLDHLVPLSERIRAVLDAQSAGQLRQENVELRTKVQLLEHKCAKFTESTNSRRQSYQPWPNRTSDCLNPQVNHPGGT